MCRLTDRDPCRAGSRCERESDAGTPLAQESPQPNVLLAAGPTGLSSRFWILLVLLGIGTGVAAGLLMDILRAAQHLAWHYSTGEFLDGVRHRDAGWRVAVLVAAGALAGAGRWVFKQKTGGHAGEVSEAIWFHSGRLKVLPAFARSVLSVIIVGMGASLGREAAPKLSGAAIANALASWGSLSSIERRLLVACGAGAGIGAVYNVPFGGALFALEVLLGTVALPLIAPAFATSFIATWVSRLLLPDVATYAVPVYPAGTSLIVWSIAAGPIAGLASIVYVRLISWADARKPSDSRLIVAPLLIFALLGLVAIPFPELLGNGKDVVQEAFLGQLNTGLSLLALLALKPVATSACLASGAPGGLFTPTLTTGAILAALMGKLWLSFWPGASLGSFAIVGAGAFLAAALQSPISALVLLLELAPGSHALTLPLLFAIAGAVFVGRFLEPRSIYSGRIHSGRASATTDKAKGNTRLHALIRNDYAVISAAASYSEVLRKLHETSEGPLYVVAEHGDFVGVIPTDVPLPDLPVPIAIATAADLCRYVAPLHAGADPEDVTSCLRNPAAGELPVIANDGELVGVVRKQPSRGGSL